MKKCFQVFGLFIILAFTQSARAQGGVEVDVAAFKADSGKSLIEVHFGVLQRVLPFQQSGPKWTAPMNVRVEITQGGKVVEAQDIKREITFQGTSKDLEDAGTRKVLHGAAFKIREAANTQVKVAWSYKKSGRDTTEVVVRDIVFPKLDDSRLSIGGIELSSEMRKSDDPSNPFDKFGYIMMPNPSGVFGGLYTKLSYYTELYVPTSLVDESQSIEVTTRVRDSRGHEFLSSTKKQPLYGPVIPYVGSLEIDGLPGDAYSLEIVVKRGDAIEAAAKKAFWFESDINFTEESDAGSTDNATLYALSGIGSLTELELEDRTAQSMYLATEAEKKTAKSLKDVEARKQFLFEFWRKKDEPGAAPLTEYRSFLDRLSYVNKTYTYQKTPGWKTARGRVYLTYGPPYASRDELFSTDSKPYIIWEYQNKEIRLQNGTKPQFVFLDRQGGGQFILIHSNVQGEVSQPNWYRTEARRMQ